jgi:hypothetical protein
LKPEQVQALQKVEAFFAQFGPNENHPGYYSTYQTPADFEKMARRDLQQFLRQYKKEERQPAPAVTSPPRENIETLQRRYLENLQRACNLLPLAALAKESDPHASLRLTLDKVYIGLNTTTQVGKDGKPLPREMNPNEETRALTALEAAANESMLVILGDPGSGKSSFINHLLWQLAERQLRPASTLLQDWPPRDCFPIRILLRELLVILQKETAPKNLEDRQRHFCSLVQQHLRLRLEKDGLAEFAPALENLLADGRGLIVFDGLDEAPPEQRELLRDAVECFRAHLPANRFIVTCRILSYVEKAVLPSFNRVELAPFDKKQINEFINRWYQALQQLGKPEDWANAKTADLQAAVQKLPPSMVRNPLLLTTLAGIHATNVELPKQRVKLYQLAGAMLLPAGRKPRPTKFRSSKKSVWLMKTKCCTRCGSWAISAKSRDGERKPRPIFRAKRRWIFWSAILPACPSPALPPICFWITPTKPRACSAAAAARASASMLFRTAPSRNILPAAISPSARAISSAP